MRKFNVDTIVFVVIYYYLNNIVKGIINLTRHEFLVILYCNDARLTTGFFIFVSQDNSVFILLLVFSIYFFGGLK